MNQAVLLFPGEMLPYHVVDYALDWARDNEGSLKVIFFLPEDVPSEGYPFPNDLDLAEMLKDTFDAEKGIRKILMQEMRYIEKRASGRHIPVHFELLYSPKLDDLVKQSEAADIIFMDKNVDEDESRFDGLSFTLDDIKEVSTRLFPVSEYDRYSDVVF